MWAESTSERNNEPLTDFGVGTRCVFVRCCNRDVRYCGESLSALMSPGLLVQVERLHGIWRPKPPALPSWIWSVQHWIRALCPMRHVKSAFCQKCKYQTLWSPRIRCFPSLYFNYQEGKDSRRWQYHTELFPVD